MNKIHSTEREQTEQACDPRVLTSFFEFRQRGESHSRWEWGADLTLIDRLTIK